MKSFDVSIVIVSWNTRDILRDCLESIYAQGDTTSYEIIVVDNASSDGSAEMVRNEFPEVKSIENTDNKGFAAANNQGINAANGRYILLLNSDTIILDNAIEKTFEFAEKNANAGIIGCKVLNADKTLQPSCFMFPSILNLVLSVTYLYKLFPKNRFLVREQMGWWKRDDIREVDVVTGCFMFIRSQALEEVGTMSEDYFMYAEETDLCYRFKKSEWKILFYPDTQIIHLGGQSSKQVRAKSLIQLRLGILQFFYKNKNRFTYICAAVLMAMFFLFRIPIWQFRRLMKKNDINAKTRCQAYSAALGKVLTLIFFPRKEGFKA